MINYRITKYNPEKRNENDNYLDNGDWTSISDIGKIKYNGINYQQYEKIETAYINAISIILKEKNTTYLKIDSLEQNNNHKDFKDYKKNGQLMGLEINYKNDITSLKNDLILNLIDYQKIIRLILREIIWMNLFNPKVKITFGYDYYMYVECTELKSTTISKIEKTGLFVEPNKGEKPIIIAN
jgi:hypothetical protein